MNVKYWISHPRYLFDRISLQLLQQRNKELPWLTRDAIRILDGLIKSTDVGVEFGSGRSTLWFAKRLGHLDSVEHDESWHNLISSRLVRGSITNVTYHLKSEPTDYISVSQNFSTESLDFALVDGIERADCAINLTNKMKKGGVLVLDNANWYLNVPNWCSSPRVRTAEYQSDRSKWTEFEKLSNNWHRIWTSDGVTATAIFIVR